MHDPMVYELARQRHVEALREGRDERLARLCTGEPLHGRARARLRVTLHELLSRPRQRAEEPAEAA